MRIAHVTPRGEPPYSGIFNVIVNLSSALAKRGHDVEVWLLHDWSASVYEEHIAFLDSAGVRRVHVPLHHERWGMARLTSLPGSAKTLDLVHLHGGFNRSNTVVARVLRTPYVFSPHSAYDPVSMQRSHARKILYQIVFERATLGKAALLAALTEDERQQLRAVGAKGPCVVIPNGVARPPAEVDGSSLRRELRLAPDAHLALFVGRLDVLHKGLDVLVRGVAAAPGWHLALVGPDHRGGLQRLIEMVNEHDVVHRVHFCGPRYGRSLHDALAAADLFTLMSRWEGLPISLLEALSHGVPALVSPVVERVMGVAGAGAGWVATPDSVGSLLGDLIGLDAKLWKEHGAAALRLARLYDWDVVAARYESAYEDTLNRVHD